MIDKPPQTQNSSEWAQTITWAWLIAITLLGGLVSFMRKMRSSHVRAWNFTEFIGEIVTSGLAGLITANLCQWLDYPMPLTYALTGIGAHMGSRALFKLEMLFDSKFPAPPQPPQPPPKDPE